MYIVCPAKERADSAHHPAPVPAIGRSETRSLAGQSIE